MFVAATGNYLMYLNALINSLIKRKIYQDCDFTLYLLHHEFPGDYVADLQNMNPPFPIIPIEIKREDFAGLPEIKRIEFVKRARFKYFMDAAVDYDVVCLMDADMFLVSDEFRNLFDLVNGTDLLIGCNERFKWVIDQYFTSEGERIFPEPVKLYKMHCSVPIIFDMKKWSHVFKYYLDICFNGWQIKPGEVRAGIGDIYAWNISIYKNAMQDKVVLFPMETMTQVHQTNIAPSTYMIDDKGYWYTGAGDPVYSIHGRVATEEFRSGHIERFISDQTKAGCKENIIKFQGKIDAGLAAIQREWYDLNFNHLFKLGNYIPVEKYWEDFNK